MLKNNNTAIITKMARRSLKSRRERSISLLSAIILSSFLIFSFFTVGTTYFNMLHIQNIRLDGGDFDAILYGFTAEQQKICEDNPDIAQRGIAAVAGYVAETPKDHTPDVGLLWADDTFFHTIMEPVRIQTKGSYPKKANEIMVTKEALSECGYENLDVGDSLPMTYGDALGEHTDTFSISGIWDGYGAKKIFFVSREFYEQSGEDISSVSSGRCYFVLRKKIMTQKEQNAFRESLHLGKQQTLLFTNEQSNSIQILAVLIGLSLITCFCAYLLIYNMMYLSVSGNIRYYGLLQTVGMTGKQINQLMKKQMLFLLAAGSFVGIFLGSILSFGLIPTVLKSMGIRTKYTGAIKISFHPAIFFLTILLTGLTVFIAMKKPARIAVSISPIEALGYYPADFKRKRRKTRRGNILWRMAKEQLAKDKKKTGIVMLSLAASLSVFLCMATLLESHGARTIVSNYMDMDLIIKNDTLKKEDTNKWKQIFDEDLLNEISKSETVKELHPVLCEKIIVPWQPEFTDVWMKKFYDMWMDIPYEDDKTEYMTHPENFCSFIIGIDNEDFKYLKENLNIPIDEEAFVRGETCVLYRNGLEFTDSDLKGKTIACAPYSDAKRIRTFEIAALTDETYYVNSLTSIPPTIIVSCDALKAFIPDSRIFKAGIRYEKEYDENAEHTILTKIQSLPHANDISFDSKIEELKNTKKAQGYMPQIGLGIVLLLAFIGILNYINTSVGNIQSRQTEIAVTESIGMSQRQVKKMLVYEGILYAGGSLLLTLTIGLLITYYLYESANYRNIPFVLPLLPVFVSAILILSVCIFIPLAAYRKLEKKGTVAERISDG